MRSGIVKSFAKIVDQLWDEARRNNGGTHYVNQHPICKLAADKLADLADVRDYDEFAKAYDICKERQTKE